MTPNLFVRVLAGEPRPDGVARSDRAESVLGGIGTKLAELEVRVGVMRAWGLRGGVMGYR